MTPQAQALRALLDAGERCGVPLLLVGAMARKLVFDDPRGLAARATRDWDFAALVPTWDAYDRLLGVLAASAFTVSLERGVALHAGGVRLDILPVGGVADADGRVRWRGDPGQGLLMAGYVEALEQAERVMVETVEVPVATVAGLTLLKLYAWADRRESKHLADVLHFLAGYGDEDRVFTIDPPPDWTRLDAADIGAWLLGHDLRVAFEERHARALTGILDEILRPATPALPAAVRVTTPVPSDAQVAVRRRALRALRDSLNMPRS